MNETDSLEARVAGIWAETLGCERVGAEDNFFRLGGHSFEAVVTIERMRRRLSVAVDVEDLLECPTVQALCDRIRPDRQSRSARVEVSASAADAGETSFLLPSQHWYVNELTSYSARFSVRAAMASTQTIDNGALHDAVSTVLDWHPGLGMALIRHAGQWRIRPTLVTANDVLSEPDPYVVFEPGIQPGLDTLARTLTERLSPEDGRVFQVAHLRATNHTPDLVVVVVHHIACDGYSLQVLLADLQRSYQQCLDRTTGKHRSPVPSSFWWASRLGQYTNSPESQQECSHWASLPRTEPSPLADDGSLQEPGTNQLIYRRLSGASAIRLRESARRHDVSVNELVIACIGSAYRRVTGDQRMLITNAHHGRDVYLDGLSCAASVGWFSYAVPHVVNVDHLSPTESVRSVAAQLRSVPQRGISGLSLAYADSTAQEAARCREIWENLGLMVNSRIDISEERSAADWQPFAHQPNLDGIWPKERRARLVLDNIDGELQFRWNYHDRLVRADLAVRLTDQFFALVDGML
jgi:hypothetical protein